MVSGVFEDVQWIYGEAGGVSEGVQGVCGFYGILGVIEEVSGLLRRMWGALGEFKWI